MSVDLTGAKMSVAQWGDLNHVIYSGHEDGTISMWDAKVQLRLRKHDSY